MIQVEQLSYSFPNKDLYNNISFSIPEGSHTALIGSNGCGKTTLIDMLRCPEDYLYDGKIRKADDLRMGYVSQFVRHEKDLDVTVFDYLCQDFRDMLSAQDEICREMENAEDFQEVYDRYQLAMDEFEAVDGYNHESNIHRQLKLAGLTDITEVSLAGISGGEYKLIQIIRQMMLSPGLLIMDEPDVFLDFDNLQGLKNLINTHKGTLLVVTHNRYLLNHCFNRILHLENGDLQEFEGTFMEYRLALLQTKIELQEQSIKEAEWIEIQEKYVEKLRAEATRIANVNKGKQLKARASYLERLKARQIKAPFVELRVPQIHFASVFPETQEETLPAEEMAEGFDQPKDVLVVEDYEVAFDKPLLSQVSFAIGPKDKVALVGPNGTGKTTLLREIMKQNNPAIHLADPEQTAFLSQSYGEMLDEGRTVYEEFEAAGFETRGEIRDYLLDFCFEEGHLDSTIGVLSGGEKNLLQLAKICIGSPAFLVLDEPTSHLDTYAQIALADAIRAYDGAVLMVSHDFYAVTDCADYVLYVEDHTIRRMSGRAFRKMIYRDHFDKDYLELEQKKREQEVKVESLLAKKDYEGARGAAEGLEETIRQLQSVGRKN